MNVIIGIVFCLWLAGFLFFFRIPPCRKDDGGGGESGVSVIIPARNEAASLPSLLRSISALKPAPGEVVVVDDGSEDATASLAREGGARVVPSSPLPPGWRGKAWACWQGANSARGGILLFLDADTRLLPGGLKRMLAEFRATGGALSLHPYHTCVRPYEELSAFFQILMAAGVAAFTVLGRRVRAGLFGQSLMISREDYFRAGGHRAVRGEILENFFLASRLRRAGIGTSCRGGRGVVEMRMYPDGLRSLVSGWSKAFAAGAAGTPRPVLALTGLWLTGAIVATALLPAGALGAFALLPAVLLYLLYSLQIFSMLRRLGNYSPLTALLFPAALFFYLGVFTRSWFLLRRGAAVEWKGRRIESDSEKGGI